MERPVAEGSALLRPGWVGIHWQTNCRANFSLHPNRRTCFCVSSVCGFRSVLFFVVKHVAPSDVRPVTTSHRDLVKSNIKDVICPMILSHRYPDDVLFFIFEDDFELFPKGVLPQDTSTQVEHSSSSSRALRPGPYVRAAIGDKQMGEEECANTQQEPLSMQRIW